MNLNKSNFEYKFEIYQKFTWYRSKNVQSKLTKIDAKVVEKLRANVFQADYSPESHQRDHEVYMSTSRSKRKRARAVLDFERREDDELGFRKNDIITIISQKDEHCWIGELNGHQVFMNIGILGLLLSSLF